jgi:RNase adaptor protein for sRNA GlmZ degradation
VTGASGAGKTATVRALEDRCIFGIRCFYFDSIGVPTTQEMARDYGNTDQWQASATREWLVRLAGLTSEISLAVLDGQTRPSFVFEAAAAVAAPRVVRVALLDCSPQVRNSRLRTSRKQPELANVTMDLWAAYLRGQADALNLRVIDTTALTVSQATDQLESYVLRLIESDPPAA